MTGALRLRRLITWRGERRGKNMAELIDAYKRAELFQRL